MIPILNDTKDLFAEEKKMYMIEAVQKHLIAHKNDSNSELIHHLDQLKQWNSLFDKDMIEPVYYSTWEYFVFKNFCTEMFPDPELKMKFMANYIVNSFFLNFYKAVSEYDDYKPEYCQGSCREMLTRSLQEAIDYLHNKFTKDQLVWGNLHMNHYRNNPFTLTPLKYLTDRWVSTSGNSNTINMGDYDVFDFETREFTGMYSGIQSEFRSFFNFTI